MQFKIGDTFLYLADISGVSPGELIGYTPTSQVRSAITGSLYGQVVCSWTDIGATNQLQLLVSDTSIWRPGPAVLDVQFTRAADGFVRSTDTMPFTIVQDVTRP